MKILIIGPYGLGNTILCLPMFKQLRERFKNAEINILALLKSTYNLIKELDDFHSLFNKIYYFDSLRVIHLLRGEKYDYSIVAFPSAKIHYNMLSFLIGSRKRIGSKYPDKNFLRGYFLNHINIPVIIGIHDVFQNLNLLKPFDINYRDIQIKENTSRISLKKKENIIGIHTGSKDKGSFKRWGDDNFITLIKMINSKFKKYKIKLFFGTHEKNSLNFYQTRLKGPQYEIITNKTIQEIIKEINRCKLFISNDSGLMHIAVFLGCFSLSIMGPSDFRRTGPFGNNKIIVCSDILCRPCSHTYFISSHKFKCLYKTRKCMEAVKPQAVFKHVLKILK